MCGDDFWGLSRKYCDKCEKKIMYHRQRKGGRKE